MTAELAAIVVLSALLFVAAGWDIASFTIPNTIPLAMLGTFAIFAIAVGMSPATVGSHLLAGFIGLVAGFSLFALGYIGGGDAKLFATTVLWLGFHYIAEYALLASLVGGALTLGLLSVRRLPLPAQFIGLPWLARLHDEKSGIPYGVALAVGALIVLRHASFAAA